MYTPKKLAAIRKWPQHPKLADIFGDFEVEATRVDPPVTPRADDDGTALHVAITIPDKPVVTFLILDKQSRAEHMIAKVGRDEERAPNPLHKLGPFMKWLTRHGRLRPVPVKAQDTMSRRMWLDRNGPVPMCPVPGCRAPMRLIDGPKGPFYGCTMYSMNDCKGSLDIFDDAGDPASWSLAPQCPDCGRPMRERTNRRDNSKFWGCTGYHSDPQCSRSVPHQAGNNSLTTVSDWMPDGAKAAPSPVRKVVAVVEQTPDPTPSDPDAEDSGVSAIQDLFS